MRYLNLMLVSTLFLIFGSCSKDTPQVENDQEEIGKATLTFTEVQKAEAGQADYQDVSNTTPQSITFSGSTMLPPVGAHLELQKGKTYRMDLRVFNFQGQEIQSTFLQEYMEHHTFLLGTKAGSIAYAYNDYLNGQPVQLGISAYLTVLQESPTAVARFILRHLNPGVKESITFSDWNNPDFAKFSGANDLDLKFELHLLAENESGHE